MAGLEKCSNGYCEIPGGTFQMGSTDGYYDERPVRNITITGFQLGQTEVSQSDYKAYCMKRAAGFLGTLQSVLAGRGWDGLRKCIPDIGVNNKGGSFPVVGLIFDEKRAYCRAQGGDLPTAAQLHYASRFDDKDSANGRLVSWHNGFRTIQPVNVGYKNRFGVYNLLGNVWESALDAFDSDFYARMPSQDPYNPLTNQNTQTEEFTGGSLVSSLIESLWQLRPASRSHWRPNYRYVGDESGFRCARPLPENSKKVK